MTLDELAAVCAKRLIRSSSGHATNPRNHLNLPVPCNRDTYRLIDDIGTMVSQRTGKRVSGRQIAGLLLAEAVARLDLPAKEVAR